jgi:hypothetical protein
MNDHALPLARISVGEAEQGARPLVTVVFDAYSTRVHNRHLSILRLLTCFFRRFMNVYNPATNTYFSHSPVHLGCSSRGTI